MFLKLILLYLTFGSFSLAEETCTTTACKTLSLSLLSSQLNHSVSPCDDFYAHVCGNYPAHHPITPNNGQQWVTSFLNRQILVNREINEALLKAKSKSKSKSIHFASDFYSECINEAGLNERGNAPLLEFVESVTGAWPMIRKAKHHVDKKWTDLFSDVYAKAGLNYIIRVNNYSTYLEFQPGPLTINPATHPHNIPSKSNETDVEKYRQFLHKISAALGSENANISNDIEQLIHFQLKLEKVYQMVINDTSSKMETLGSFSAETNVDWLSIMNQILTKFNSNAPKYTMETKTSAKLKYISLVIQTINTTPIEVLQNFYGIAILQNYGPLTTKTTRELLIDFNIEYHLFSLTTFCPFLLSEWPLITGRVYVDAYFSIEEKAKATNMVNEIRSSFRTNIQTNNWLDSETRKHAIEKLDAMKHMVGFDEWILSDELVDKHSGVLQANETYQKGKFLETYISFRVRDSKVELETGHREPDSKLKDFVSPVIVNAFYSPGVNSIFIPAAVLQPPFFDHKLPISMAYGAIGFLAGHELTHGFDANGRKYDLHGKQFNWWTNATLTKFLNKTKCIQEEYDQIHDPTVDKNINGAQTLSENIADNGGIKEAFAAYQTHLKKYKDAQVLPNLSYNSDQLFFVSYANIWCQNIAPKRLKELISLDSHSPNQYRVNVVLRNFEQFSNTFKCPVGSQMNPVKKCSVW